MADIGGVLGEMDLVGLLQRLQEQQSNETHRFSELDIGLHHSEVQPSEEERTEEHDAADFKDVDDEEIGSSNVSGTGSEYEETKEFDIEIFIEEIKNLPCLWNTSTASYKDRNCKLSAWEKLSKIFGKDGQ